MIVMIAAASENNALGKDNELLWHLSDDFKRFKKLTSGHTIIMGRKTFESLPKTLPNRTHIIITRDRNYLVPNENCHIVHSLEAALKFTKKETICLTHNDFRLDNLVLDPNDPITIIGVLDWELATLGDPLMDLGNSLAYWIQDDDDFYAKGSRRQPTHMPGMLTRKEVVKYYLEKTNSDVDDFTFYEVYGLFRLAGIVQQIYYRYHHKQTSNPVFKNFWLFVHYLLYRCRKAIKNPIYFKS